MFPKSFPVFEDPGCVEGVVRAALNGSDTRSMTGMSSPWLSWTQRFGTIRPSGPRLSEQARALPRPLTAGGANMTEVIDPEVPPSGTGCLECLEAEGWWLHLRRCARCGHIGCCDDSLGKHASAHAKSSGHPVIRSFEPGEDWFWDYQTSDYVEGPSLAPPQHQPVDQTVPGPAERVPANWERLLG